MDEMYPIVSLGETAEKVADKHNISREDQDKFALESQRRAIEAINSGRFNDEIFPITVPQKKGDPLIFDTDEYPRYIVQDGQYQLDTDFEILSSLQPAFREGGTVTAGNSSGINDGAAALRIMSKDKADTLGLKPVAKWLGSAISGVDPGIMGIGPVPATHKVLAKTGIALSDIDQIELNEAFAAQALYVIREMGMDMEKTNVNGSGISLGHPVGATGAIQTVKLMNEMTRRDQHLGRVTMCVGGGQGVATIFERLN